MYLSLANIHQESIGSCTSINFTATAGPDADGVQAVHWSAQEGVISRYSPAPLPNLQAIPEKVLKSSWFRTADRSRCPGCDARWRSVGLDELSSPRDVRMPALRQVFLWDRCKEAIPAGRDVKPIRGTESVDLGRCMFEFLAIVPAVAAMSIGTRSILKSRARRQRSERREQRHKREAGIWWATMWLSRDKRQRKLTYLQD